jgi:LysM repeat protein
MYAFYLDGVQLPVTPSKVSTKITNQNRTINLINDGEVNILKAAGLTEVSFNATIPQVIYPFAVYPNGFKEASFFLDKFETLKKGKKPFQLIVSRVTPSGNLLFDTNLTVSMEDYAIEEDAKNGLDLEVSIRLKQFRPFGTKRIVVQKQTGAQAQRTQQTVKVESKRASSKQVPKTHKVVRGDTLWAICKKYLGNGAKYPEIAKLNSIKNPNLIYPGQVIRLG